MTDKNFVYIVKHHYKNRKFQKCLATSTIYVLGRKMFDAPSTNNGLSNDGVKRIAYYKHWIVSLDFVCAFSIYLAQQMLSSTSGNWRGFDTSVRIFSNIQVSYCIPAHVICSCYPLSCALQSAVSRIRLVDVFFVCRSADLIWGLSTPSAIIVNKEFNFTVAFFSSQKIEFFHVPNLSIFHRFENQ